MHAIATLFATSMGRKFRQALVGVFVAEKWLEATAASLPGREEVSGRLGFEGREAPAQIAALYMGRRDAEFAKARAENPEGKWVFEYSNIKPHVSGDVAVVTYNQKTTGTGSKIRTSIQQSSCRLLTLGRSNQENG